MAENNNFSSNVESLFKGMDAFLTTKTVVGDAIQVQDGTIILPLVDVSFGLGAGAFADGGAGKNNAGGGMGGKMTPSSVLIVKDNSVRLVNVKNQDTVTKILDMVPDLIDKFVKTDEPKPEDSKEVQEVIDSLCEEEA